MNYTRPGEYLIKSIRLISDDDINHNIEISSLVVELNIYENMFMDAISGKLAINDTNNLLSNFPIIGQERVNLLISSFRNDGREVFFQHDFKVYNYTSRTSNGRGSMSYVLELVSPELLINEQKKVCASFKGMTATDVAKRILTNSSYGLNVDSTKRVKFSRTVGTSDFIIPNWRPYTTLNWLATKGMSPSNGGYDFAMFFYEAFSPEPNETQVLSSFNFKSFGEMFRDKSEEVYTYYPASDSSDRRTLSEEEFSKIDGGESSHNRIISYSVVESYNIIQNINMGMYSSTVRTHDIIELKVTDLKFKYSSKEDLLARMRGTINSRSIEYDLVGMGDDARGSNYSESYDSRIIYRTTSYDWQRKQGDIHPMTSLRNSQLKRFDNIRLNIDISGNLERSIGDVITLKIPSEDASQGGHEDRLFSGDYVITAIRHKFTPETYQMHLNVTKDNYFKTLSSIREGE